MDLQTYLDRRSARTRLVALAPRQPSALRGLLVGWVEAGVEAPEAVFAGVRIPEHSVFEWVPWASGAEAPLRASGGETEGMLDLALIRGSAAAPGEVAGARAEAAALYLAARLGEEVAAREVATRGRPTWPATPRDADAAAWWARVLGGQVDLSTGRVFRALYGDAVRKAFAARCLHLRLPADTARRHAGSALDMLDCVAYGPHLDVAARLVEGAGEPVASLVACLSEGALDRARACCDHRPTWRASLRASVPATEGRQGLPGGAAAAAAGRTAALHLALRVRRCLEDGSVPDGPLGLPGWPVVTQNRGKQRGRLRGLFRGDPQAVAAAAGIVSRLDAPWARTRAAVARHAWDWAWREARAGFSFSMEAMEAPACVVAVRPEPSLVADAASWDHGAVLTLLLQWIGRGVWEDLSPWMAGEAGRTLSDGFYRALSAAPDALADPGPLGRSRTYAGLRRHLTAHLPDYFPRIEEVACRVARLRPGRSLKASLHGALRPPWRDDTLPLPAHHLPGFVAAFQAWSEVGPPRPFPGRHPPPTGRRDP